MRDNEFTTELERLRAEVARTRSVVQTALVWRRPADFGKTAAMAYDDHVHAVDSYNDYASAEPGGQPGSVPDGARSATAGEKPAAGTFSAEPNYRNLLLGIIWAYASTSWRWTDDEPRDTLDDGLYDVLELLGAGVSWWNPHASRCRHCGKLHPGAGCSTCDTNGGTHNAAPVDRKAPMPTNNEPAPTVAQVDAGAGVERGPEPASPLPWKADDGSLGLVRAHNIFIVCRASEDDDKNYLIHACNEHHALHAELATERKLATSWQEEFNSEYDTRLKTIEYSNGETQRADAAETELATERRAHEQTRAELAQLYDVGEHHERCVFTCLHELFPVSSACGSGLARLAAEELVQLRGQPKPAAAEVPECVQWLRDIWPGTDWKGDDWGFVEAWAKYGRRLPGHFWNCLNWLATAPTPALLLARGGDVEVLRKHAKWVHEHRDEYGAWHPSRALARATIADAGPVLELVRAAVAYREGPIESLERLGRNLFAAVDALTAELRELAEEE